MSAGKTQSAVGALITPKIAGPADFGGSGGHILQPTESSGADVHPNSVVGRSRSIRDQVQGVQRGRCRHLHLQFSRPVSVVLHPGMRFDRRGCSRECL